MGEVAGGGERKEVASLVSGKVGQSDVEEGRGAEKCQISNSFILNQLHTC